MVVADLARRIFANKLVDDDRLHAPWFTFRAPVPGGGADCSFLSPCFAFYFQLVAVIVIQSCFNAILGALVYTLLIAPGKTKEKAGTHAGISSARGLFAYGVALPLVVLEPLCLLELLDVRNTGLRMVFLATPIVGSLRITEALYGFTPIAPRKNLSNYVIYFSCVFGILFDQTTGEPKRTSLQFLSKRVRTIGRDFVIVSAIISVLHEYGYEYFATKLPAASLEHSLADLFAWQHLLNNFFMAVLISFSLSQSSLGVSLIYNILYGYQTYEIVLNPMFQSASPSEFWGRRWNTLVHQCLKNGVYKPARRYTASRMLAMFATFAVSGLIHEYVNFVMFAGGARAYHFGWKQMLFFGWNGVLLALEYRIGHWGVFRWMSRRLPLVARSALVLCAALPLAHLFTGDWIRHGYFEAVYLAEPILACRRHVDTAS